MTGLDDKTLRHVAEQARLTPSYLTLMALAGVLAAVALLANSIPILIGAMVVAPALAPLALVALAMVGGEPRLALRGLAVGVLGIFLAAFCAMRTTWVMNVTNVIPPEENLLDRPLLEERIRPGWYGLAAACAAGIAGTVALSKRKTDRLVGTVAALALVPAAAAAGIAFMSRDPVRGLGGVLLLGMNIGLIVAMGLLTLVTRAWYGWERSGGAEPGGAGTDQPRAASGKSGLATWALVPLALVVIVVVLALPGWFTAGPGKGLSTPAAL